LLRTAVDESIQFWNIDRRLKTYKALNFKSIPIT